MKKKPIISPGRVADSWAELDRLLARNPYIRFSLDTHRNWDDVKKRVWQAVVFQEKGQVVARAYGETRDLAVVSVVQVLQTYEAVQR